MIGKAVDKPSLQGDNTIINSAGGGVREKCSRQGYGNHHKWNTKYGGGQKLVKETRYQGQFQGVVVGTLWGVLDKRSFGVWCESTLEGIRVKKIAQVNIKILNHGVGSNCGISLRVGGSHLTLD